MASRVTLASEHSRGFEKPRIYSSFFEEARMTVMRVLGSVNMLKTSPYLPPSL